MALETNSEKLHLQKARLYQQHKDFKRFMNLSNMRIFFIRNETTHLKSSYKGLELYSKVLEYLNDGNNQRYSFDEKMFYLIECCDPNLDYLRIYNNYGRPDKETEEYQQYLSETKNVTGFTDENIRIFENIYVKNVLLKSDEKKLSRTKK